ncbi:MAG: 3-oxoacyl-ACP reductase [Actinobacteria bacterium 13_2_20CM_2_66_6]|nr:MAG: 3-oxoacyl-ACP reductase [Actinobacteria bacterium 13_2_20CM_2_66_6]
MNSEKRAAIVTGGASGIGASVAKRLELAGVHVRRVDITPTPSSHVLDVTDEQACRQALSDPVDILVNCAGVAGLNAPSWKLPDGEFERVIAINLTGTYYMCRAALPGMVERGWGRIVNVASIAGKEGNPNAAAYSSSKAGVIGLTKSLAKEVAGTGVLVNCVTPAVIDTPMLSQASEEHLKYMVSKIPMGRVGQPDEVAALIACELHLSRRPSLSF